MPQDFIEVAEFPETRSGKYVRRMVRALVEGGDSRRRLDAAQPRQPDRAQDRDRQLAAQAEAVGGAAAVRALPLLPHPVQYGRAGQEGGDGVRHQPAGQRAQRTRVGRAQHRRRPPRAARRRGGGGVHRRRHGELRRRGRHPPVPRRDPHRRGGARPAEQRPARVQQDRGDDQAVHRRDPGRRARRRHGVRAGVPLPDRRTDGAVRAAGNTAAADPGVWRHAAVAAVAWRRANGGRGVARRARPDPRRAEHRCGERAGDGRG